MYDSWPWLQYFQFTQIKYVNYNYKSFNNIEIDSDPLQLNEFKLQINHYINWNFVVFSLPRSTQNHFPPASW